MTRPIHGAALAIAAALLVLSGCGGDGSTTPSGESADAGTTSGPTDGGDTSGSAGCVGKKTAKLTLTPDEDTSLPGGGTAALESADLDAEPPTATLRLGDATRIERKNAAGLVVGDQFGLQRAVYKVVGICDDQVLLDEF